MNSNTKNILLWIVMGAVIGWLASAIVGVGSNLVINVLVGIAGSFIGGYIFKRSIKPIEGDRVDVTSILIALLGAIILEVLIKIL